ncbi:Urokinase plasminogen activator surface receptor [Anabarilius grahami]|uniref:Urokinase plasminogen activator surface receptor n=1 Tax=Anabarilius grahami TaxID=495550 RepID=A0A3N0Y3B5_ANAGA|nr:Urokinase plasminogen activator surface receptor [Anabarilius grahami]
MDLQISVFLLFILFTAGHSLNCTHCMDRSACLDLAEIKCPDGYSKCESSTTTLQVGDITKTLKSKGCAAACKNGSMNVGIEQSYSVCCDTNGCNYRDTQDNVPNGKECYSCDKSCTNILSCSGIEDRCMTAKGIFDDQSKVVKGCVSRSFCDGTNIFNIVDISCCEGNLCNGDQSATTSATTKVSTSFAQNSTFNSAHSVTLLLLCYSLLSYFLLN